LVAVFRTSSLGQTFGSALKAFSESALAIRLAKERTKRARSSVHNAKLALATLDVAIAILAGLVAKFVWLDWVMAYGEPIGRFVPPALILGVLAYLILDQMGQYDDEVLEAPTISFGRLWGAWAIAFILLVGLLYLVKYAEVFSRAWMMIWFVLAASGSILARSMVLSTFRARVKSGELRRRVALFGLPSYTEAVAASLKTTPFLRVDAVYEADSGSGEVTKSSLTRLHLEMIRSRYDQLVVCIPRPQLAEFRSSIDSLACYSGELLLCSEFTGFPVPLAGSRRVADLRMDIINVVPLSERFWLLKRALDYVVAASALIVLFPLLLVTAIAIKLDTPGPVFFLQHRYGRNNKVFRIFKFRTMRVLEDGSDVRQATVGDPRVTRVGRFLRSTSIDELPQIINVLLGDMSIVGPRPHAVAHDDKFERELDMFRRRRRVMPGLTGWAQVNGFRGETRTTHDIQKRMDHDLFYIDNWSIWLDLEIMARTIFILRKDAY
jgi:Undecaprenyl-phosphate glucose phosphotransferase